MIEETAGTVAAGVLEALGAGARPLVIGGGVGALCEALSGAGAKPVRWTRLAGEGNEPQAWPSAGAATSALIRLPKAREALAMALHAAAAHVAPAAPIVIFGENGEGIRSVNSALEAVAERIETIDTRRHCRVIKGTRRVDIADLKGALADWRQSVDIEIAGVRRSWIFYPGLFAHGRLDPGSALLIASLPAIGAKARVLDYGCGSGALGFALRQRTPGIDLVLLDADAVALEAARENVPDARMICAQSLKAAGGLRFDAIVSNPPLHAGVKEDTRALERLIADAPGMLRTGGSLVLVVQRRIRIRPLLEAVFLTVTALADDGRYSVFEAREAKAAKVERRPRRSRQREERGEGAD